MHPDQMYDLRQLQHSDLRMESERARAVRAFRSCPTGSNSNWFMIWLRRLIVRQLRGITVNR